MKKNRVTEEVRVSLEPGVLRLGATIEEDVLLGSHCNACGRYFFPLRRWCAECAEPTAEPVELSREGRLSSFTKLTRKPPFSLIEPPFILGEVLIPEGILVYSIISAQDIDSLQIGQKLRLTTREIKSDDRGRPVIAYTFSPAG